jgi:hypothetical protein
MADNKPLLYDRKLLLVAPLVIAGVAIVIVTALLLFRPSPRVVVQPPRPVAAVSRPDIASRLLPPLPLTRHDLIAGAIRAAGLFAAKGVLPGGADPLVGRRFSIRLPFGCGGVAAGFGALQMSVAYNAVNRSVALTAQPGAWAGLPLMQNLPNAESLERVEGFWIPRAWTDDDSCSLHTPAIGAAVPTAPTAQTVGLAQLFESGGSRAGQHGQQPYSFTRKLPDDAAAILGHSYWLVLEGTVTGYTDGQALHCWQESPEHQPVCIFAVRFDRVAFQDADSGETLATWTQ